LPYDSLDVGSRATGPPVMNPTDAHKPPIGGCESAKCYVPASVPTV